MTWDAIVVGAGHNGLAAAVHLCSKGWKVLVLEQAATAGGAVKTADSLDSGVIVTVCCDAGWKYLSTGAWTDDIDVVEARAKQITYF